MAADAFLLALLLSGLARSHKRARCCSAGFENLFSMVDIRMSNCPGSSFEGRFSRVDFWCADFLEGTPPSLPCVCAFLSCAEKRNCQPTGGARNIRLRKNMLRIEFVADITFSQECSVAILAQALRVRAYAPCGGSARESHLSQLRRARTERSH